ncbi:MBL fold metallo-hydrolase [Colwellia sp. MT41]|uniref:MBL fold metallo-hydrolase n=1 Tax=Colwellia sp. MT41 TaxID=58049 RepID=UPI00071786B4|nr:MBL fold metallo-hydrolase [Colwellia sp. MT41]ALO35254.1 MBL fold metallo-hydrolase [Colwellia sp. MT41]
MVNIEAFYHSCSSTISYIVFDQLGGHAIIIDSVLDFSLPSGKIGSEFADKQIAFIKDNQLTVDWILETHAHADHLSAAHYLKSQLGGKTAVSAGITIVQQTFKQVFNISDQELLATGDVFDVLLVSEQVIKFGQLRVLVLATPGHTNDSLTYLVEDHAFVGDTLFMPDGGTARCDFPGGDAGTLFDSIKRIHALAEGTKLWLCHDYQPNGRVLKYTTTVAESKRDNIHINDKISKADFIQLRQNRDKNLAVPKLLYPAIQVNIRGGKLPSAEQGEQVFLKIPIEQSLFYP